MRFTFIWRCLNLCEDFIAVNSKLLLSFPREIDFFAAREASDMIELPLRWDVFEIIVSYTFYNVPCFALLFSYVFLIIAVAWCQSSRVLLERYR